MSTENWDRYRRKYRTFHGYEYLVLDDPDPTLTFHWRCGACRWDSTTGARPRWYAFPVGVLCPDCGEKPTKVRIEGKAPDVSPVARKIKLKIRPQVTGVERKLEDLTDGEKAEINRINKKKGMGYDGVCQIFGISREVAHAVILEIIRNKKSKAGLGMARAGGTGGVSHGV